MLGKTSFALASVLALGACGLGSTGGLSGGDDDQSLPENALCQSTLTITGTLAPEGAPTADQGCVPQGTWTVNVAVADLGDCDGAPVDAQYVYTVTGTGHNETITFEGSGDETELQIHADDSDGTACDGSFEHIWAGAASGEYNVMDLRPIAIPSSGMIAGEGTFQLWSAHP